MRPPSIPILDRTNPKKYFIYWNHDVPFALWDIYERKRIRIKIYKDINRYQGEERENYANEQLEIWKIKVLKLNYNPFLEELSELGLLKSEKKDLLAEIEAEVKIAEVKAELPEEDKRKLFTIPKALEVFMESRRARKLEPESISAYQGCIDWIYEGLSACNYHEFKISELKHLHLAEALNYIAEERDWVATTINKGVEFMMTVFNFLETHDYIVKNPSKGKFIKLPTNKRKHQWFERDIKKIVVDEILRVKNERLLRACQFTYFLMIRSKKELRKLRVGDIDRVLKRVRFSADLSKTKQENYRDYPAEFEAILNELHLERYPKNYYIFGAGDGMPGLTQCGHNYFSKMFMVIKDRLELSMDYTIYGFKHTRIVHELMKGTDGYMISHMARHNDKKSTKDYMRDYDITLVNVYGPEDLTF